MMRARTACCRRKSQHITTDVVDIAKILIIMEREKEKREKKTKISKYKLNLKYETKRPSIEERIEGK